MQTAGSDYVDAEEKQDLVSCHRNRYWSPTLSPAGFASVLLAASFYLSNTCAAIAAERDNMSCSADIRSIDRINLNYGQMKPYVDIGFVIPSTDECQAGKCNIIIVDNANGKKIASISKFSTDMPTYCISEVKVRSASFYSTNKNCNGNFLSIKIDIIFNKNLPVFGSASRNSIDNVVDISWVGRGDEHFRSPADCVETGEGHSPDIVSGRAHITTSAGSYIAIGEQDSNEHFAKYGERVELYP
jgi:hypothetical protein